MSPLIKRMETRRNSVFILINFKHFTVLTDSCISSFLSLFLLSPSFRFIVSLCS